MKLLALLPCLMALSAYSLPQNSNFLASKKLIDRINARHGSWKASGDFLSSIPWSQIKMIANDTKATPMKRVMRLANQRRASALLRYDEIPEEFDAREQWGDICPSIGKVLDQGDCGAGWAVSTAAAFTDRYCIETEGKQNESLSAAHILYCEEFSEAKCEGGFDLFAWEYIIEKGIPTGGAYQSNEGCEPYNIEPLAWFDSVENAVPVSESDECQSECTNADYKKPLKDDLKFASELKVFLWEDEELQLEILTYGPATVFLKVHLDFIFYVSGVYDVTDGESNFEIGNHSLKVIGWGVENDTPYWLVQNSWGKGFGDNGYIKIKRDSEIWNFAFAAIADVSKEV